MKRFSAFVLLAAGFLGTVTSASAQIARDQSYYEETKVASCNASGCTLEFSAVPQLILFSKINCYVAVPQATAVYALSFQVRDISNGSSRRREFLPVPISVIFNNLNIYTSVIPTDFMVSASRFPVIFGFTDASAAGGTIECKITGRLVSDPH
jgi:hypothetical protein